MWILVVPRVDRVLVRAEWAWLCYLSSVSLSGLISEMGPRCLSLLWRLNKIRLHRT